ncbi:MAG: ATP-binding domain-containing protein [Sphingomonadales bacterium]
MREQLEKEGRIVGPEKEIKALKSAGYTTAEKSRAKNYFEGDQVIFNRERNGVSQGEVLSVVASNPDANTVAMLRENGETVIYKPGGQRAAQAVDILRSAPIGIRQGDLIRFTRNDESLGLVNSGMAEVADIDKQGKVTLIKEDGGKLTLEGDAPALRFIDHAWASTVHAFQGRTVDHIIGVMHASHPHLTHQKAFYVEVSRARESATLITDDRQKPHGWPARDTRRRGIVHTGRRIKRNEHQFMDARKPEESRLEASLRQGRWRRVPRHGGRDRAVSRRDGDPANRQRRHARGYQAPLR